jgi:hypothetical protein
MNRTEEQVKEVGYEKDIAITEEYLRKVFGNSESQLCFDTYQFDDYSKVDQDRFDVAEKAARRKEHFPNDCQRAFEMGIRIANGGAVASGIQ